MAGVFVPPLWIHSFSLMTNGSKADGGDVGREEAGLEIFKRSLDNQINRKKNCHIKAFVVDCQFLVIHSTRHKGYNGIESS